MASIYIYIYIWLLLPRTKENCNTKYNRHPIVDDQRRELQPCLAFDKPSSNLFL